MTQLGNAFAIAAMLGATALAASPGAARADGLKAEVAHEWTSGSEAAAAQVIADAFTARGGEWIDTATAGFEAGHAAAINRILGGNPPTVKMFPAGPMTKELIAAGLMSDIDGLVEAEGLKDKIPPVILDSVSAKGSVYAAPLSINVHWLIWSAPVLAQIGLDEPPATWDAFFDALDKVKAAGLVPIAWGGQSWQENKVFNGVMLGVMGVEGYDSVYVDFDAEAVRSPEFREAAEIYAKMRGYVDPGAPGRLWNDATAMVLEGKAAAQYSGDWVKGEMLLQGREPGSDFFCEPMPGAPALVIQGDTFAFPKKDGADWNAAQQLFAVVVEDPQVQLDFSRLKGSIPARSDVDVSSLDACVQKGKALIAGGDAAPAPLLVMSPSAAGQFQDLISEFFNDPAMSTDDFVESFAEIVEENA
ncbi:ABC transporter substrate-binding protein [Poseidonocella sp. HB161398]|uniref:ABC transporter substrate-binding protein n=1 Tax=Poseidonocella sp. HB161398 TaxID=2320855 RepID=UPI001108169E|nr:ABC transporter substrate-binding protein [Poseidonocella sp. HB161398]